MKKEILIYSAIYSYTVVDIINQLEEAKDSDIRCRVNSPGGEVYYAYGAIAKYQEHPKGKYMQVDGIAASAAAFMCCCSDEVVCLDVSTFLFHRAAFPTWIESDPESFTESRKSELNKINKDLRAIMEGKFTADVWEKVTGVSLDELFSLDSRIDVTIDAKQAKKIGLVKKINSITPDKKAEIEVLVMGIAALSVPNVPKSEDEGTIPTQNIKTVIKMTLAQFKADHPEVYAEATKVGTTAERDRVGALMAFVDIDPESVVKAVNDGTELTQKMMAEFTRKGMSAEALKGVQADSAPAIATAEIAVGAPAVTPEAKAVQDFDAIVRANLGLKK